MGCCFVVFWGALQIHGLGKKKRERSRPLAWGFNEFAFNVCSQATKPIWPILNLGRLPMHQIQD